MLRLETLSADSKPAQRKRHIEALGRAAHSLKGASRVVGVAQVEKLAHRMESIFDAVQSGRLALDADMADVLYDALDTIQAVLNGDEDIDVERVLASLEGVLAPASAVTVSPAETIPAEAIPSKAIPAEPPAMLAIMEPEPTQTIPTPEETIRVTIARLDALMADASDLLIARSSIAQRLDELKLMRKATQRWQKEWRKIRTQYIRAMRQATQVGNGNHRDHRDHGEWTGLLDFLTVTQRYMRISSQQLLSLDRALNADYLRLNLISDSLQDGIRRVRLVPFETHIPTFQRAVRDLAREQGKEVLLQVSGANIELDKRVLEAIKDPILHLLRNAIDHGIETPAERSQHLKPRTGMIILAISQRGGNISILIADDGRGIDVAAGRRAARRILSDSEMDAMRDPQPLSLIILPLLSPRPQATTTSRPT